MRISTNMLFDRGVASMNDAQSSLLRTQNQLAAGRRILTPSDDPVASARALEVKQALGVVQQYGENLKNAEAAVNLEESVLASVTAVIQDVQQLAVTAGNGGLSLADRQSLATELRGKYQNLLALANSTDAAGQYLFSGYKGSTVAFIESSPGNVSYQGDQGQRLMQIGARRQLPVSDSGDVFTRVKTGNGVFESVAATGNRGQAVVGPGTLVNRGLWDASSRDYEIRFAKDGTVQAAPTNVTAGVSATAGIADQAAWDATGKDFNIVFNAGGPPTTYDIIDNTSGATIAAGQRYGSGSTIAFNGMRVVISDSGTAPAAGDTFRITENFPASYTYDIVDLASARVSLLNGPANQGDATLAGGVVNAALWDASSKDFSIVYNAAGPDFRVIDNVSGATLATVAAAAAPGSTVIDLSASVGAVFTASYVAGPQDGDSFNVRQAYTSVLSGLNPPAAPPFGRAYVSGAEIAFKSQGAEPAFDFGVSVKMEGEPQAGDTFNLRAARNQSMFTTIETLATLLQGSTTGTQVNNAVNAALNDLNGALNSVLTVRASVGARLREIDSVRTTGEDIALQHQQTISALEDLDFAKAISDLNKQQIILEAAQKSYVQVTGLSLFNFIR